MYFPTRTTEGLRVASGGLSGWKPQRGVRSTAVLFIVSHVLNGYALAACDQTLSVGANIVSALKSAAAGSTICLNSGSYGSVNISGVSKSSPVILQSTDGQAASLSLGVELSSQLTFRSLTIRGMYIHNQAKNIVVSESKFTDQLLIQLGINGGSNYGNANILIDKNSFDSISVDPNAYEGRLQILSDLPSGVKISNNHFGGPGESDGIQVGANGVVIGPGNVFDGIRQLNYGRHVDSIQLYGQSNTTITGNYFINNDVQIMAPDGGTNEVITNNVFIGNNNYRPSIQFGSLEGGKFEHNTVFNIDVGFSRKKENPTNSSNVVVRNNIYVSGGVYTSISDTPGSGCTNCTFERNLFNSSGNAIGTNNLIGSPTFSGGASPTAWAGYQLLPTSLGYKGGLDGLDLGTTFYGVPISGPNPSPKIFRSRATTVKVTK